MAFFFLFIATFQRKLASDGEYLHVLRSHEVSLVSSFYIKAQRRVWLLLPLSPPVIISFLASRSAAVSPVFRRLSYKRDKSGDRIKVRPLVVSVRWSRRRFWQKQLKKFAVRLPEKSREGADV